MASLVPVFMVVMGCAIAGVWTSDIVRGRGVDISQGVLRAREPESGTLLWPHWIAEYGTAAALISGAVGMWLDAGWAEGVALLAVGALIYTSTNSLGWALADRSRAAYAAPMAIGATGGLVAALVLVG